METHSKQIKKKDAAVTEMCELDPGDSPSHPPSSLVLAPKPLKGTGEVLLKKPPQGLGLQHHGSLGATALHRAVLKRNSSFAGYLPTGCGLPSCLPYPRH